MKYDMYDSIYVKYYLNKITYQELDYNEIDLKNNMSKISILKYDR